MKRTVCFSVFLALSLAGKAGATAINFYSGDGLNESNSITGTNVLIPPDPAWALPLAGSLWVSYTDSGSGGAHQPDTVAAIPGSPTAWFYEQLGLGLTQGTVTVLADDTASVYLFDASNPSGELLKAANPVQGTHCADGPISCGPNESWMGSFSINPTGNAYLAIGAFQRVANTPYGLDYAGSASNVPEPASIGLIGLGLVALGFTKLRRKQL